MQIAKTRIIILLSEQRILHSLTEPHNKVHNHPGENNMSWKEINVYTLVTIEKIEINI